MKAVEDFLLDLMPEIVRAAIGGARRVLNDQPEGWARDGVRARMNNVFEAQLRGAVRATINNALAQWDYYPEEIRGCAQAERAFERLIGRKPDRVTDIEVAVSRDFSPSRHSYSVRIGVELEAAARRVLVERSTRTLAGTRLAERTFETLPGEKRAYGVTWEVPNEMLEDLRL